MRNVESIEVGYGEALQFGVSQGTYYKEPEQLLTEAYEAGKRDAIPEWQPIETAPKSTVNGRDVHGVYILGFCPDHDACDLESCICVVWWEPLMNSGSGMWYGEGGYETHPTHWMPLPAAPKGEE